MNQFNDREAGQALDKDIQAGAKILPIRRATAEQIQLGVTVCLVVHNEEKRLARCLSALVGQHLWIGSQPLNIEIVIIDNLSTDATIRKAEQVLSGASIRWRILRMTENNLGAARDLGLREAKFEFVAFTDADCIVPKNWIATLVEEIVIGRKAGEPLAAVGSGNRAPAGHPFYDALNLMAKSFIGNLSSSQIKVFNQSTHVRHLSTSSVIYHRESLISAGGFNSKFATVCEDVDASCRLVESGATMRMLANNFVDHHHECSYSAWAKKIFRYGWGQPRVLKVHPSYWSARLGLPLAFGLFFMGSFAWGIHGIIFSVSFYFLAISTVAIALSVGQQRLDLWNRLTNLFVVTHFAYSFGMLVGFLSFGYNLFGFNFRETKDD